MKYEKCFRALGREGQLFTEAQVNNIVAQNTIENTMAFTAPQLGMWKIDFCENAHFQTISRLSLSK